MTAFFERSIWLLVAVVLVIGGLFAGCLATPINTPLDDGGAMDSAGTMRDAGVSDTKNPDVALSPDMVPMSDGGIIDAIGDGGGDGILNDATTEGSPMMDGIAPQETGSEDAKHSH